MGATQGDEEQLAINVIAKLSDLEKQMAKANGITAKAFREMTLTTQRATRQMETDAARSAERINAAMATVGTRIGAVGRNFAAAAVAAFSTEKLIEASQAYVRASNALKVAGLSGSALTETFGKLYDIAQANGTPIETLVGLYSKAAQVQTALGASSGQLIQFTTAVAEALRVSGTSAEQAQGALLQMGQALGSGTLHAEEYNSMLEGAYPILQAAAAGIKEAGGEVSKLTTLVKAGEVSSKAFFYGVLAGAPTLSDKLAGSTETLSQAWTKFGNSLTKVVGELDAATGATGNLAGGIESLIPWLEKLPGAIDWASEKWRGFKGAVNDAAGAFNHFMGYDTPEAMKAAGLTPINEARDAAAKDAIRAATKNPYTTGGGFGGDDGGQANKRVADAFSVFDKPKTPVTPVSLKDFPAEAAKKKGGGADGEDEFDRAIRRSQEHASALEAEAAVVGRSTEEKARATETQRLLTAAKQADIDLTPAVQSQIDSQASAYARAEAELERLEQAQHRAIQAADGFRDATKDVMSGFLGDLRQGKSGAEALANALNKIQDKIADKLISNLVDGMLGASGTASGGLFKSLLGLFGFADGGAFATGGLHAFANGGAFTNSIVSSPTLFKFANGTGLMGEAGPEAIMPLKRDSSGRLGVSAPQGAMGGGSPISISVGAPAITINGSYGNAEVQQLRAELAADRKSRAADTVRIVNEALSRGHVR